jgi:aldose 1-epimerase
MRVSGSLSVLILFVALASSRSSSQEATSQSSHQASETSTATSIGGEPVVTLKRPASKDTSKPHFLEAIVAPGRGMNTLQIRAYLPGKGEVDLFDTPSLAETKKLLDEQDDAFGNKNFSVGAAILLPFPNRITGKLSPDGKTIATDLAGKTISLPANWSGKKPGAQVLAMHGLILSAKFENIRIHNGAEESSVSGVLHAGDFGGHWLSQTDVQVHTVLKDDAVEFNVTAKNVGHEAAPIGIAFHPWYRLLSGQRPQVRLHVPASERVLVNNYDDVVPTGKVEAVKGTPYDFTAPGGVALDDLFMDDFFLDLKRDADGGARVELIDPAADYGLRVIALSPEIKGFQVYAPLNRNVVAIEPQFNLADPYSKVWGDRNTGMPLLQPGQSVSWRVRLELFVPSKSK